MEGSCGGLVMEMVICSGRSQPMTSCCWATSRGLGEMSLKEAELTDPRGEDPHPPPRASLYAHGAVLAMTFPTL